MGHKVGGRVLSAESSLERGASSNGPRLFKRFVIQCDRAIVAWKLYYAKRMRMAGNRQFVLKPQANLPGRGLQYFRKGMWLRRVGSAEVCVLCSR